MSHELETTEGTTFFADSRKDAWHQLGQKVDRTMTAAEVLQFAHLGGWNVRKMPLQIPQEPIITPDGVTALSPISISDKFATVRTNPITGNTDYLGVVGTKYEPVQNEDGVDLLNAIVDESGAHFETAGSLYGGRKTFVTMKLPNAMEIVGQNGVVDKTEWYLAALNSHDGSTAFQGILTPVRIVCANTQAVALRSAKSSFSIRHSVGAKLAIGEARRVLGITWKAVDAISEEFQRMSEIPVEYEEAKMFANELVKVSDAEQDSRSATMRNAASGQILNLFQNSPTIKPIAGTRYALYNAVTEYEDHYAIVRSGRVGEDNARALRTIRDLTVKTSLKAEAFRRLVVPV